MKTVTGIRKLEPAFENEKKNWTAFENNDRAFENYYPAFENYNRAFENYDRAGARPGEAKETRRGQARETIRGEPSRASGRI